MRSAQIFYLLKRLSIFIEHSESQGILKNNTGKESDLSIIACGDFNSGISKPAIRMMFGDNLDDEISEETFYSEKFSNKTKEQELYAKILKAYRNELPSF